MKVVINVCFGGFDLSPKALEFLGLDSETDGAYYGDIDRASPDLVRCIETLGDEANGFCSKLRVVEIPDDVKWEIANYDGNEWVEEVHRKWY